MSLKLPIFAIPEITHQTEESRNITYRGLGYRIETKETYYGEERGFEFHAMQIFVFGGRIWAVQISRA